MDLLKTVINEARAIKRALRRKYYIYFRIDYVNKQMKTRKGICGRHGCCDIFALHKIYYQYYKKCLSKDCRWKCLLRENLPRECQIYPLDEKDKILETKGYCNFYWGEG